MAGIDLRPMTLGEVLDRTFSLYKSNFWLFAGIFSLPYLIVVAFSVFFTNTIVNPAALAPTVGAANPSLIFGELGLFLVIYGTIYLLVFAAAQAATVMAVSDLYLGRTASVAQSFTRVRGRFLTVLIAMILVIVVSFAALFVALIVVMVPAILLTFLVPAGRGALAGVALIAVAALGEIAALVLAAIIYCRMALAVPSATLEPIGAVAAVRRSFRLTKGTAWGIFAVYLLVILLASIAFLICQVPFLFAMGSPLKPHVLPLGLQILQGLATWISGVIVFPVGTIALSLIYYNQRVRKEAFDLEHLIAALGADETLSTPSVA